MKSMAIAIIVSLVVFLNLGIAQTVTDSTTLYVPGVELEKYVFGGNTYYQPSTYAIGRHEINSTNYTVSRIYFEYDLSSIPTTATISQVKVEYSTVSSSYTFKLTKVTSISQGNNQANWTAIGNGSVMDQGIVYDDLNSFISSNIKTQMQNLLSSRKIILGAFSENETADDSQSGLYLLLSVTYQTPAQSLPFIAKNDLHGQSGGQIGVGVDVSVASRTSPYEFDALENQTINLQAYDDQTVSGDDWLFNDTEAPSAKSEWERDYFGAKTSIGQNASLNFSADPDYGGSSYIAYLKKKTKISRSDQTEFDGTSSAGVITHIVEQNSGNISAPSTKSVNGKSYYFSYWTDNNSSSNPRSVTPTDNTTYTAYYKAHLYSTSSTATTTNSQRKIVQSSSGDWAMVYTSSNKIWLSLSTDGTNWNGEVKISDDPYVDGYPSIALDGNTAYIVWQGINWAGGTGFDFGAIYMRSYNLSTGALGSIVTVQNFTPNIEAFQANPVIDVGITNEEKMIAWRESNGIKVRYYDNHDGWSNITSIMRKLERYF